MADILSELYRTSLSLARDMGQVLERTAEQGRDFGAFREELRSDLRTLGARVTHLERRAMKATGTSAMERRIKWSLTIMLPLLTLAFTGQVDNAVKLFEAMGAFVQTFRS
jgi:hypothetical protein